MSRSGDKTIVTEVFRGISQSLQENVLIVPQIRPGPLFPHSFAIRYTYRSALNNVTHREIPKIWFRRLVLELSLCVYSSLLDLAHFFTFLFLYTVGRTPWTGDQPVARPLPTHRAAQTQNKRTQTSTSGVGFEPMIPVFERAKTVHALDRAATVIGWSWN
jgi:hypothetical protein